jgi:hypothetical protein
MPRTCGMRATPRQHVRRAIFVQSSPRMLFIARILLSELSACYLIVSEYSVMTLQIWSGHSAHQTISLTSFCVQQRLLGQARNQQFQRPIPKKQTSALIGAAWRVFSEGACWYLSLRRDQVAPLFYPDVSIRSQSLLSVPIPRQTRTYEITYFHLPSACQSSVTGSAAGGDLLRGNRTTHCLRFSPSRIRSSQGPHLHPSRARSPAFRPAHASPAQSIAE